MRMNTRIWAALPVGALLAACGGAVARTDDMKPFPPAEAGMQRMVIRVPEVADPEQHKIEILIGKTIEVDCNRHAFATHVTQKVAEGWGFDYYVIGELKGPMGTLMACPPDFVNRREFVRANAEELGWLRYNPRLPIVLYVPEGVEVRYRVWTADATTEQAQPD